MKDKIIHSLSDAAICLNSFLEDEANIKSIENAAKLMAQCLKNGGKIIAAGNGGSMSDAMHFAEELSGRFRNNRRALAAIAISDPGHITCVANDFGFEFIFSRAIEALGNENDVFLGISTSGNSENILNAAKVSLDKKLKVISLTGKGGGKLAEMSSLDIQAPNSHYADRAQEIHIKVIHILIELIEYQLNVD